MLWKWRGVLWRCGNVGDSVLEIYFSNGSVWNFFFFSGIHNVQKGQTRMNYWYVIVKNTE